MSTIEVEYEVGTRVTGSVGVGVGARGTVVAVVPTYEVRWDADPVSQRVPLRYRGEHIQRADPDVGDHFAGDDDPYIASLPDGTVVVTEDGAALLRRDGKWVDGWLWTSSGLDLETTFTVLHLPKEVV